MTSAIQVFSTTQDLKRWRRSCQGTVGFVPTMGALHEGHATLLRKIRPRCDISVLSIFVNPTQFGPNEDFNRYPRTFEKDLELAKSCGVDVVFAPTPELMYKAGHSTFVEETSLSQSLCGPFRPGHFKGVTTVVLKLFNLVEPQLAFFGMKDAQQFFILHKMAQDLDLDLQVEGISTVREADGLALSSRNAYLSAEDRQKAPVLYQKLRDVAHGENLADVRQTLQDAGFRVQYLERVRLPDFSAVPESQPLDRDHPYLIAVAAYLDQTRLIDNVILNAGLLRDAGLSVEG